MSCVSVVCTVSSLPSCLLYLSAHYWCRRLVIFNWGYFPSNMLSVQCCIVCCLYMCFYSFFPSFPSAESFTTDSCPYCTAFDWPFPPVEKDFSFSPTVTKSLLKENRWISRHSIAMCPEMIAVVNLLYTNKTLKNIFLKHTKCHLTPIHNTLCVLILPP